MDNETATREETMRNRRRLIALRARFSVRSLKRFGRWLLNERKILNGQILVFMIALTMVLTVVIGGVQLTNYNRCSDSIKASHVNRGQWETAVAILDSSGLHQASVQLEAGPLLTGKPRTMAECGSRPWITWPWT